MAVLDYSSLTCIPYVVFPLCIRHDAQSDNAFDMKKAAIELLYVLLEDTHPDTKTLAKRISETLNYTYLDKCFEEFSGQGSKQDM